MKLSGTITKVSGPLVVANGLADANVSDVVRVGEQRLIGEILNMTGDSASIQVYEETSGLGPGAKVETTGMPLSVELGPGMLENIYDGIQRPLPEIRDLTGSNITRGIKKERQQVFYLLSALETVPEIAVRSAILFSGGISPSPSFHNRMGLIFLFCSA